jgi:hypothetical protein
MRSHGGGRSLIKIKICCGENEESTQEAAMQASRVSSVINQSDEYKENIHEEKPHRRVTPSAGCNRKSISEKWWSDLRAKNSSMKEEIACLKNEKRQLQLEKSRLETENGLLLEKINLLKDENRHLKKECFSGKTELMKATEVIGAFKDLPPIYKVTDKDSIFQMVAAVLLHVMNIIMRKTQQVTRLRTLTQVIFRANCLVM